MKVRPLGDKILVKRAEALDKTDAGIFLPESAKDTPKEGKVIALGSGILNKETGRINTMRSGIASVRTGKSQYGSTTTTIACSQMAHRPTSTMTMAT